MNDFLKIIEQLQKADVNFVVVGGLAAAVHGSSMLTQDVDICCDFSIDNLLNLQTALANYKPVHRMDNKKSRFTEKKSQLSKFKNIYLNSSLGQLDCLSEIKGIGKYKAVLAFSEIITINSMPCKILSIIGLIKSKKSLNRPKDKLAVIELKAILNKK